MPRVSPNQGEGGGDEGQGPGFNWDKLAKKLDQQHQVYQPPQQPQPAQVTSTQPIQRVTPAQINQQAQQVIQAPVPQSYIDQMTPTWNDLVKGRSTAFQSQYWTASPYLWTQLVTARYREQTITKLADKLPGMDAWVRQQDAFGGHPGALTQLRAKALNIPNPVVRIQALTEIDALAALDPETQTQFLAQMSVVQNHDVTALQPRKSSSETTDTTESPALDQGFQQLLGDQYAGYDQTTGDLALHAEVGQTPALDPVQQAALHDLFPQLFERNQQFGRIVSLTDVARSVAASQAINEAAYQVASPILNAEGDKHGLDAFLAVGKNPLAVGESALNAVGVLTSAVTKPVSAVGHAIEDKVPGGTVAGGVLGVPLRIGELALNAASTGIGDVADAVYHARTGQHLDDSTKQFWGNLGLIVVLHGVSEVAGTASKALAGPAEYTEGTIEGIPAEGSMVQNTLADGQWRSAIAHPLDTYMDPLLRQGTFDLIQKLRSTETSNWVTWGRTTDLFKTVETTVDELGPEKAKAALTSSYPSFGRQPGLLDTLVDARRASAMPQAVMDLADGVKTAGLEEQLAKIDTAVKATQEQIAAATEPTLKPVNLENQLLDKTGRAIGDVPPDQVVWVKTEDLYNAPATEGDASDLAKEHRQGTSTPGPGYDTSLEQDIQQNGFPKPIEVSVDPATGEVRVTDGNHALEAAHNLGEEYVPVRPVDVAPADMPLQQSVNHVPQPTSLPDRIPSLSGGAAADPQALLDEFVARHGVDPERVFGTPNANVGTGATAAANGAARALRSGDAAEAMKQLDTFENVANKRLGGTEWQDRLGEPSASAPAAASQESLQALQDQLDSLKAQRVELRSQASEVYTQGKFYEFPNRRTLPDYLHRVFYRPTTLSEQLLRKLLNPMSSGKLQKWSNKLMGRTLDAESQSFLEKWTDKIGQEDKLRAPHLASTPADRAAFNDMNTTYLNRLFKRFGVSETDRVATLSKVMNAPDAQQFWEAVTRDVFGNDGILAKYMPKNTPQVWRDSFLGRYDVNSNNLRGWITDENGMRQPVIPGETKEGKTASLPGAPSEFASYVPLPSAGELDRILSGYRRLAENLHHASKFPTLANAAGYALDFNRAVVHLSTSILKPVALIANLPAIILTKQIDEGLGNVASPGIRGTFRAGSEADSVVGAIPPEITGNAFAGAFQDTPTGVPGYMPVATRNIIDNGIDSERANLVYATQSQILTGIANDPFYSQFARDGFDVAKMKDRMNGTDAAMTHHYSQNLSVSLDRAGMSLDEYLPRVEQYLREATFDNPDYLEFIKTGKMSPVGSLATREWHGEVQSELYNKWLSQRAEMSDVRAAMNQLDREGASSEFRAHQAHLKDLMEQVDDTEAKLTEFGGVPEDKLPVIDRTRPQALANDIRNRFSTGEIKLPTDTWVSANAKHPWAPGAKNALEAADEMAQKFSNYIYGRDGVWSFRQVGRAEGKFARGSFYEQRGLQYYKGFKALGYSDADATAFARLRAGIQARDMFYDLTARSSAERALRNIFWFAPVNAELMYRWLYAIPAQAGGLIPGALITGARAEAWDKMLKQTGIVQVNADGQQVLPISGMGSFLNMVSGGKVKMPDTLQIPLASLNPHLTSPIPQLSPLPALALHQVSDHVANSRFSEYAPVLKTLSNAVAQHSFTSFVPNSIRNAYGFFTGKPGMWSNDAVQQQFDHAHDVALQYAAHDLQVQGILPPVPPGSKVVSQAQHDEYMQQLAAYQQQLYPLADDYARGTFLISTLSSAVVPGYITASDKDQKAYQDWYKNTIAPQLDLNNGQMSSAVRQQWMRWMHNHPNSLAFSASYSEYTGQTYQPDVARTDQEYYTQLYLHNVKATMSPDDYQEVLPALMSHTLMEAKLQGNLNKIAPDNSPATMLRNWGQHSRAIGDYQIQWQNYLDQNPRARDLIQENKDGIAAEYPDSIAADSVERTYVQQALQTLSRLAPKFTGESSMPDSEYKTVVSKLKEINANLYTATGGDLTPMEQGISWYFDNVLDPYFKQTNALYNKASQLQAAGLSQGDVYSRIDRIKNSFNKGLSYGGEKYPTIDEFFYGTKTPTEQKYAVTSWMTKPTSWLSDWQRKKVGYTTFKGEDTMFKYLNTLDTRTQAFIEENKVYPGSNWADAIDKWQQNQAQDIAAQFGKPGLAALKLEQADPYVRLRSFGYGAQNATMQEVYKMVDYTQTQLTKAGLSPSGYSEYATSLKLWVYNYIAKQESADPKFSDLMQRLEFSTSPLGGAQSNPTGVPLWEAIFYGNYNPSFIPQSLIDAAPRGSDVT